MPSIHNAVHVDWVRTETAATEVQLDRCCRLLAPDEYARMARFMFERDRRQYLLTRALVRTMLSRYAPVLPTEWRFGTNQHGRPEILNRPPGVRDLRFNLSHTEGLIACAVTVAREVGVDVEYVGRLLVYDVADRFFAPREAAALRALPAADQPLMFFDFWTLKESYIKARGLGLAMPLADFAFRLDPPGAPVISFESTLDDDPAAWQFVQSWPSPMHRLALAVRRTGPDVDVRIREVESPVAP